VSCDEALQHIATESQIWLRLAAVRDDDGSWSARLVELTSGAPAPSWEPRTWEYPGALFHGQLDDGAAAADCLRKGTLKVGDYDVSLGLLMTDWQTNWERQQSRANGRFETLDWPAVETTLPVDATAGVRPTPPGHLVAAGDAPSFLSFYAATAYFFWKDRGPAGGQLPQEIVYRHQDLRGRINLVRLDDEMVEVQLEGGELDAMIVELAGDAPGQTQRLSQHRGLPEIPEAKFKLAEGLPPGSWVLLRSGAEWIDRRFLSVPWNRGPEAGVEIVIETANRLEALVTARERQQVEFKQQLPKDDQAKATLMKTICAFANGIGGSALIGVTDERAIVGLDARAADRAKDQLTQMIGSWIDPRPSIDFNVLPIADSEKVVLELSVEPGYALHGSGRPGEVRTPYVRHQGVTERATTAEITAIVRARTPLPTQLV